MAPKFQVDKLQENDRTNKKAHIFTKSYTIEEEFSNKIYIDIYNFVFQVFDIFQVDFGCFVIFCQVKWLNVFLIVLGLDQFWEVMKERHIHI